MRRSHIDMSYFEDLYARDGDPWSFETSDYERQKYAATISALPKARYAHALEVGCSVGVLTRLLAARCDRLVSTEPVERAIAQARARCEDLDGVTFLPMAAPDAWPDGTFDLIVLSEVVYYFTREQVVALAARVRDSLRVGANVLLVHWIGETDYPLSGDDATAAFLEAAPFLSVIRQERTADYRLDLCTRPERSGTAIPPR